jgi:uncharacterized SAM-binding protein YcdF (DUF218 family)
MFVTLSKLLPVLVYPTGLIFLLILAALLLRERARLRNVVLLAALAVLLLAGNRYVALRLVRSLEWRYFPPAAGVTAEAIVVLGGGTEIIAAPRPIVEVNGAGDRVTYAAELFRREAAPLIVASGGRVDLFDDGFSTPAEEMGRLLEFLGVPGEVILLEDRSQNTYENALYSAELLKARGLKRILLVTSAMHMPRAVPLFIAQGLEVIPAPADYSLSQAQWEARWQGGPAAVFLGFFPAAGNLNLTTNVIKEYLGMLVYGLQGWF